jgi:UDP-N-acetylmuramoyl-L-alanyl-D-glutamate--2,6-diaminopimelate ligase
VTGKRLSECVDGVPDVWFETAGGGAATLVSGVAIDSRQVRPGDLFVAMRGAQHDGHDYIAAAVGAGAVAVLAEAPVAQPGVTLLRSSDTRRAAAQIAARFFDHPSRALGCIGVTGTNGKTSVAQFTAALLSHSGHPAGYGGTLGWGFGSHRCGAELTTEDAVTVQRRLAALVAAGAQWVAMEVSSHALAQGRVDEVAYRIAVFTNLSRDHLDYHETVEAYAAAKRRLFEFTTLRAGVVNWDDPQGRAIYAQRRAGLELLRFGTQAGADVSWSELQFDDTGIAGVLHSPWGRRPFRIALIGEFSLFNFAAAAAAACLAGAKFDAVVDAGANLTAPHGRMQFVRRSGRPLVVIDYAHTPDALTKVLQSLRRHCAGRLICVFGCGGDRDRGKRPLMAQAVEADADAAWVTSDNPRSEDPAAIAAQIVAGFGRRIPVAVELDRATAIAEAIAAASVRDLVLVAGKGHEDYQDIAGERRPFRDIDVVQRVLAP